MLTHFRNQIDHIDDTLVDLLAQRFEIVKQVGTYKKENNISSLQPTRWQEVLSKRTQKADEYGLDNHFIIDIWNRIHEYSLELEEKEKNQ